MTKSEMHEKIMAIVHEAYATGYYAATLEKVVMSEKDRREYTQLRDAAKAKRDALIVAFVAFPE